MQEYKVPEFTVMSLSAQQISASLNQEFDDNNAGAGGLFPISPNVGNGK